MCMLLHAARCRLPMHPCSRTAQCATALSVSTGRCIQQAYAVQEEAQQGTGDPQYPKVQWPTATECPTCRSADGSWVEAQVLAFLQRFYAPFPDGTALGLNGLASGGRGSTAAGDATAAGGAAQQLQAQPRADGSSAKPDAQGALNASGSIGSTGAAKQTSTPAGRPAMKQRERLQRQNANRWRPPSTHSAAGAAKAHLHRHRWKWALALTVLCLALYGAAQSQRCVASAQRLSPHSISCLKGTTIDCVSQL